VWCSGRVPVATSTYNMMKALFHKRNSLNTAFYHLKAKKLIMLILDPSGHFSLERGAQLMPFCCDASIMFIRILMTLVLYRIVVPLFSWCWIVHEFLSVDWVCDPGPRSMRSLRQHDQCEVDHVVRPTEKHNNQSEIVEDPARAIDRFWSSTPL
jgi:hypothetical protein